MQTSVETSMPITSANDSRRQFLTFKRISRPVWHAFAFIAKAIRFSFRLSSRSMHSNWSLKFTIAKSRFIDYNMNRSRFGCVGMAQERRHHNCDLIRAYFRLTFISNRHLLTTCLRLVNSCAICVDVSSNKNSNGKKIGEKILQLIASRSCWFWVFIHFVDRAVNDYKRYVTSIKRSDQYCLICRWFCFFFRRFR